LHEERPLLLEERLVGGEVDDGWIRFHLPEVGVDRGVEREVGCEPDLRVEAGGAIAARPVAIRVALLDRLSLDPPDGVRQQLDVAIAREPPDTVQLADVLHAAGAVARYEVPLILFLVAVHPTPRVEPPDLLFL